MNCEKHPKYKAIHNPKVRCLPCWIMYEKTVMDKLVSVRSTIRELRYPKED